MYVYVGSDISMLNPHMLISLEDYGNINKVIIKFINIIFFAF